MEGIYEKELRNLKSESTALPSIFERVKGLFSSGEDKSIGTLDKRENIDVESQSLIGAGKGLITKTSAKLTSAIEGQPDSSLHQKNYKAFRVFLIVGVLFLFLSLTFLPLIFIAPNKFNLFFSLGSFFIQLALAFFHGPIPYAKLLFKRENLVISIFYAASLLLALYSSIIWGTYLSAILVVALQVSPLFLSFTDICPCVVREANTRRWPGRLAAIPKFPRQQFVPVRNARQAL